jgi:L-iditol 2-dehydrogenase
VRGRLPVAGERLLVIGAGTLGQLTVAALRAVAPEGIAITVLARHAFQAQRAVSLGATRTVLARGDYAAELADAAGTRLLTPIIGRPIGVGGFDAVYVCAAGTRSLEDAMRFAGAGAVLTLLANVAKLPGLDWTPLWLKELQLRGTLAYGSHTHGAASLDAFHEAAALIAAGRAPVGGLVTHTFPIAEYRAALAEARAKGAHESIKVAFAF